MDSNDMPLNIKSKIIEEPEHKDNTIKQIIEESWQFSLMGRIKKKKKDEQ